MAVAQNHVAEIAESSDNTGSKTARKDDVKILVVDDTEDGHDLLEVLLFQIGYKNLVKAYSAEEALEQLSRQHEAGKPAGLVLLDILMPVVDGVQTCSMIRADERFNEIPILMVTANTDENKLKEAFEAGAMDYLEKPISKTELEARIGSALRLKKELARRKELLGQLQKANKKLELLSSMDSLTDIANRRTFNWFLEKEWRRSIRKNHPVALIMIDIDFFKLYNDTYGHQKGDSCLKQVASVISAAGKRPGDLVARYGGEEFAVILAETDLATAENIAENIRKEIEKTSMHHENSPISDHVTLSLGVASMTATRGSSPDQLVEAADSALYMAKRAGRNKVCLFRE